MSDGSRDPQQSTAAAVALELRGLVGKLKRRLREQADIGDLTPSQTAVLLRLDKNGPSTTSALARAEGMRPQSMGSVIATLEALGLVFGSPDPADGRQTLVSLTERCRQWLLKGRAARQDWLSCAIGTHLSPQEVDQVAVAISLLQRLVDD